jgi:hypothetical protein
MAVGAVAERLCDVRSGSEKTLPDRSCSHPIDSSPSQALPRDTPRFSNSDSEGHAALDFHRFLLILPHIDSGKPTPPCVPVTPSSSTECRSQKYLAG